MKFCSRLKESSTEAYKMQREAYGELQGKQSTSKEGGLKAPVSAISEVNIHTATVIFREDH